MFGFCSAYLLTIPFCCPGGGCCYKKKLLAPSEAFRLLHVLEHFLVLAVLRVHAHACNGDGSNASRDAEAPIDSGIHGCVVRQRDERLRVLFWVWYTTLWEEKGGDDEA